MSVTRYTELYFKECITNIYIYIDRKAIDVAFNKPKDHENFEKYIINNTAYIIWQCSAPGVSNNVKQILKNSFT